MLAAANRLRSRSDFSRTTKIGHRATSKNLVLYFLTRADLPKDPQLGLIINKSVGGSVVRHRIARQLRHIAREQIAHFPNNTQLVVRVLRKCDEYQTELSQLMESAVTRLRDLEAKR